MDIAKDRRSAPRVVAQANSARVRRRAPGHDGEFSARVVDISRTGALIACDDTAPSYVPLWLRLSQPASSDWVSGSVTRHVARGLLAVAFHQPCPGDMWWCATTGVGFGSLFDDIADGLDDGRSRDDWMF